MVSNQTVYARLRETITSIFDTSAAALQVIHIKPTSEPYKALEAPVLEIATFTLNEGESKPALENSVQELANGAIGRAGVIDASWGPIVEKPNAVALFIGWTTVEVHLSVHRTLTLSCIVMFGTDVRLAQAHWDLVHGDPELADLIGKCAAISTIELVHVPLAVC